MLVFEIFTERLLASTASYEAKFKAVLATVSAKIPDGDVERFWQAAPWLLLLQNPLSFFSRAFFDRDFNDQRLGFIRRETAAEIEMRMNDWLVDWHTETTMTLAYFAGLLQRAPLTEGQRVKEVVVPSILLWKNLAGKANPRERSPEYLDPIETFDFLAQKRTSPSFWQEVDAFHGVRRRR